MISSPKMHMFSISTLTEMSCTENPSDAMNTKYSKDEPYSAEGKLCGIPSDGRGFT